MKPFFSVIIPTLNEEKYLPHLLNDLIHQSSKEFEVIVVDGKSEDLTQKKALSFSKELIMTVINSNKRNVSIQKNSGGKGAQGEYLIFLDADCRINKGFIHNLKRTILSKKGLVFLPYVMPEDKSSEVKVFYKLANYFLDVSQSIGKPFGSVGGMVMERNFFLRIGGFDETVFVAEDHSIIRKAYQWGVKAKFMPNVKIIFSFRRIKREGKIKSLYKFIVGHLYLLFKGDIKKRIFDYEMKGGALYVSSGKQKEQKDPLRIYGQRLKVFIKKLLEET